MKLFIIQNLALMKIGLIKATIRENKGSTEDHTVKVKNKNLDDKFLTNLTKQV
jgi:hypothetical protein